MVSALLLMITTAEDIADATGITFSSVIASSFASVVIVVIVISIAVSLTCVSIWALAIVLTILVTI